MRRTWVTGACEHRERTPPGEPEGREYNTAPMRSVAILGAGAIGATVARALAEREVARHVVLVDAAAEVARGKALDIAQSGPIDGWDTRLSGTARLDEAMQPTIVVLADRHGAD